MEIDIIDITETHYTRDIPTMWEKDEHDIVNSPRQYGIYRQGVTLILNKQLIEHNINYECLTCRLLKVSIEFR